MALSLAGATEASHMDHPDFRVGGKIFATLQYPRRGWGMVALTPDEQLLVVQAEPDVFVPANGAWGRRGATLVDLKAARKRSVRTALAAAWRRRANPRASSRTQAPTYQANRTWRAGSPPRRPRYEVSTVTQARRSFQPSKTIRQTANGDLGPRGTAEYRNTVHAPNRTKGLQHLRQRRPPVPGFIVRPRYVRTSASALLGHRVQPALTGAAPVAVFQRGRSRYQKSTREGSVWYVSSARMAAAVAHLTEVARGEGIER